MGVWGQGGLNLDPPSEGHVTVNPDIKSNPDLKSVRTRGVGRGLLTPERWRLSRNRNSSSPSNFPPPTLRCSAE